MQGCTILGLAISATPGSCVLCALYSAFLADSRRPGAVPSVIWVFFCSMSAAHRAAPTDIPSVSRAAVQCQRQRISSPVFVNAKNIDTNGIISKTVAIVPYLDSCQP